MAVLHLTKENFDASIAEGKVIVDFWASGAVPAVCRHPFSNSLTLRWAET